MALDRQLFICQFTPAGAEAPTIGVALMATEPHRALAAFVHLEVPADEPGRIVIRDEHGVQLLSEPWPPERRAAG